MGENIDTQMFGKERCFTVTLEYLLFQRGINLSTRVTFQSSVRSVTYF